MKNFTLTILGIFALVASLNAQIVLYEQNFEVSPDLVPSEITLINGDGFAAHDESDAVFTDSAWIVSTTNRQEFAGTKIAIACSYYENYAVPANDWMILPTISVGADAILSWDALSLTSTGDYPDEYMVVVAPAGTETPTIEYFETNGQILFQVIENTSAQVSNPGPGLAQRTINLAEAGFVDANVWIAFVLITGGDGGAYIGIDNIKVMGIPTSVSQLNINELTTSVFPNPTTEIVSISLNTIQSGLLEIEIFDLLGKLVKTENYNVNAGKNEVRMNVEELEKGIYILSSSIGELKSSTKLVIR